MSAIDFLRRTWRSLKNGRPSERFRGHHRRNRHHGWRRPVFLILGVALIAAGIALSIPPGVPGFVVVILGAGLVASQSHAAAQVFDRLELRLRGAKERARRRLKRRRGREND